METKINIAEIIRNKPHGIKLYSPIFGKCTFCCVHKDTNDICVKKHNGVKEFFDSKGLYYNTGEVMLFPSKEMRDWTKFSWKKGDVLVGCCKTIVFDGFTDDTYTLFKGKYCLQEDRYSDKTTYISEDKGLLTKYFHIPEQCTAQAYIKVIERKLGSKLNLKTFEVEKEQPEFKDGDIVVTDTIPSMCYSKCIFILKGDLYTKDSKAHSYVFYNISNNHISFDVVDTLIRDREIRLATNPEKLQLFDILTKEGKYWDAEKKQIVDIKKEHQFKPFEKVLVRDSYDDMWRVSFFSHIKEDDGRYVTTCITWRFCVPYEGNEHLLGTTKDSK